LGPPEDRRGAGFGARTTPLIFFPDGKRLAIVLTKPPRTVQGGGGVGFGSPSAEVRVIDLQAQPGKELYKLDAPNYFFAGPRAGAALAISPDGARLAQIKVVPDEGAATPQNTTWNYCLTVLDAANGKKLNSTQFTYERGFASVSFSPDGGRLAVSHMTMPRFQSNSLDSSKLTLWMFEADTAKELFREVTDLTSQ